MVSMNEMNQDVPPFPLFHRAELIYEMNGRFMGISLSWSTTDRRLIRAWSYKYKRSRGILSMCVQRELVPPIPLATGRGPLRYSATGCPPRIT